MGLRNSKITVINQELDSRIKPSISVSRAQPHAIWAKENCHGNSGASLSKQDYLLELKYIARPYIKLWKYDPCPSARCLRSWSRQTNTNTETTKDPGPYFEGKSGRPDSSHWWWELLGTRLLPALAVGGTAALEAGTPTPEVKLTAPFCPERAWGLHV